MLQIAVIIANRNNARYLDECLRSVLRQTLLPREIIVVDDASTDDSGELLESYRSKGMITLLTNNTGMGVAASRHRGVMACESPFFTTLDADDYYFSADKLAAESRCLESQTRPGSIAFSDVMRVDASGVRRGLVSEKRQIREGDLSFRIPHLSGFIPRDYLVAKEDYIAVGGFNSLLGLYEDWDLKIRLSRRCPWIFSGTVGTAYRDNPQGLSKSPKRQHVAAMRSIFVSHCSSGNSLVRATRLVRFFFYHSFYLRRLAI